jgi:hypothetical protein
MKKVRWLAPSENSKRVLSSADFEALGVGHSRDEVWEASNEFTVSLANQASEKLVQLLPDEFVDLTDTEDESSPAGSADSSHQDQDKPEGSSSESVGDGTTKGDESHSKRRRRS